MFVFDQWGMEMNINLRVSLDVSSKKGNEVQEGIFCQVMQVVFNQKSENNETLKGFKCEMWPRFLVYLHVTVQIIWKHCTWLTFHFM